MTCLSGTIAPVDPCSVCYASCTITCAINVVIGSTAITIIFVERTRKTFKEASLGNLEAWPNCVARIHAGLKAGERVYVGVQRWTCVVIVHLRRDDTALWMAFFLCTGSAQ